MGSYFCPQKKPLISKKKYIKQNLSLNKEKRDQYFKKGTPKIMRKAPKSG